MHIRPVLAVLLAGALAAPLAAAAASTADQIEEIVFSEVERQVMERYFDEEWRRLESDRDGGSPGKGKKGKHANNGKKGGKGMPPGLAKRGELPPGLAKRETLPPGLAKRELPDDLERRLPPPRPGTERLIVEGTVVLVEKATGKVLDVLEEVLVGQ